MSRAITAITSALMLTVAVLAFIVSFDQIRAYSVHTGAVMGALAYCIPPLVDLPIVTASLVWLSRSAAGEQAHGAKVVVGLAAAASLALNMAGVPHHLGAWARLTHRARLARGHGGAGDGRDPAGSQTNPAPPDRAGTARRLGTTIALPTSRH